jgi:hypothetical protein
MMAVLLGLLQAAGNAHAARAVRPPDPVRVWRADSTVYVQLGKPGHVALLHVDAIGRIQVLFPLIPEDTFATTNESPVAVPLPPNAEANPATFVAVWSRWPFDFTAIRAGSDWNYDALLMQPTAGDPLGALLDITDRITDGRPYDYGVVEYSRGGTMVAGRQPVAPTVCLSCVRHGTAVAAAPAPVPANAVDCANASLTNSFCGTNSGSVSITGASQPAYQPAQAAPAPAAVYVPYFLPMAHGFRRRFEQPPTPPAASAPRSQGVAFPIAPRLVVPSGSDLRSFTHRRP